MKFKILFFFLILALILVSCSSPLRVTEVKFENMSVDLGRTLAILDNAKPDSVPAFPDPLPEGAGEIDTLVYLGNVISAYKTSLEAWQNYSEAQHTVLLTLQQELKNDEH